MPRGQLQLAFHKASILLYLQLQLDYDYHYNFAFDLNGLLFRQI